MTPEEQDRRYLALAQEHERLANAIVYLWEDREAIRDAAGNWRHKARAGRIVIGMIVVVDLVRFLIWGGS